MLTAEQKQKNREQKKARDAYYKGLDEQPRKAADAAEREQKEREEESRILLILTEKKRKLLNLALNAQATENEWQMAIIGFAKSLRNRKGSIQ